MLTLALITNAHAGPAPVFYIRPDKPSYLPGESGTLSITIRNQGDQAFTVKNMTIQYSWMSFINDHWEGNETVRNITAPLAAGQAYNTQRGFTVPSDGRAQTGFALIQIGTDIGGGGGSLFPREPFSVSIGVASGTYEPFGGASSILHLVTIALLAVAVALLALLLVSIRRMAKK